MGCLLANKNRKKGRSKAKGVASPPLPQPWNVTERGLASEPATRWRSPSGSALLTAGRPPGPGCLLRVRATGPRQPPRVALAWDGAQSRQGGWRRARGGSLAGPPSPRATGGLKGDPAPGTKAQALLGFPGLPPCRARASAPLCARAGRMLGWGQCGCARAWLQPQGGISPSSLLPDPVATC